MMMTLFCPRHTSRHRYSFTHISTHRVLTVSIIAVGFWTCYHWFGYSRIPAKNHDNNFYNEQSEASSKSQFVVDTPGCSIPDVDPFDSSLKDIVLPGKPLVCTAKPAITFTEGRSLRINETALYHHYDDTLDRCQYEKISRPKKAHSDDVFEYSPPVEFTKDVRDTGAEFIRVACFGKRGQLLYANFHALIWKKNDVETRCNTRFKAFKSIQNKENIFDFLIVGVDAVSRLNFIRQMPKTRSFLQDKLHATELQGYNKVADNTFVNLVPMFAGKFTEELPWDDQTREIPFDNYTFVWKEASSLGYRTLYAEDAPNIAIFNYDKPGFHKAPSDYYLRPFSLAAEDHGSVWNANHNCIGPKPETEVVLDYVYDFMNVFQNKPRFAFTFITRLTHDGVNKAGAADELYLKFFKKLQNKKLLENTLILFYSDHGMRFGPIRETYIGQLEERLPFLLLSLPKNLREKHPRLLKSLKTNINRLTTPFDIFTTLSSLIHFKGNIPPNKTPRRGMNLLSDIPIDRSCPDAAIPSHWCTCHQHETLNPASLLAQQAALSVIDHINDLLLSHGIACATLVLDRVTKAHMIIPNSKMKTKRSNIHDLLKDISIGFPDRTAASTSEYVVTFRTNPGGGMFEANVRKDDIERTLKVVGDISRINRYGDQSVCIQYYKHKPFCYCN